MIRTPEVYAVPRADGRLVVGATVEEQGFDLAVTAGGVLELLRRAYEALPGIAELELVEASARACGPPRPTTGRSWARARSPGSVWATGHWRNGILLAPITAEAVAGPARRRRAARGDALPSRRAASRRAEVAR